MLPALLSEVPGGTAGKMHAGATKKGRAATALPGNCLGLITDLAYLPPPAQETQAQKPAPQE